MVKSSVLHANVSFIPRPLYRPLQLSSGTVTHLTEARAEVRIRVGAREAIGRGAIYLGVQWAWPERSLTIEQRDAALRELCELISGQLPNMLDEPAHPLELGLRLGHRLHEMWPDRDVPPLARMMCASPFDAAIHDAAGRAIGRSSFDFYRDPVPIPSADPLFGCEGACRAIADIIQRPRRELEAWFIVSPGDALDGQTADLIRRRGYRCFKLKTTGRDNQADVARTIDVFRAARQLGVARPTLVVDSNEGNPDAASVLDYLQRLQAADRQAFDALRYLEQPTHRDILTYAFDWRPVTALKPVLLDEGLTDLSSLPEARRQNWSGLALKTCKGHSFILTAAAWARRHGLMLTLQDLTNPGLAAIHAALFAAHIPMGNGVELNSPQFTPAANTEWLPRLAGLFEPRNGVHRLPEMMPIGLGFAEPDRPSSTV